MDSVCVARSALKHGLSVGEILEAWENFVRKQMRSSDAWIAISFSARGREIELVALDLADGDKIIIHAMSPAGHGMRRALGLRR